MTTKLSVGKALDKLRGTDTPQSTLARLKEKNAALDEEIRLLRARRRRLERDQEPVRLDAMATTPNECRLLPKAALTAAPRGRDIADEPDQVLVIEKVAPSIFQLALHRKCLQHWRARRDFELPTPRFVD